MKKYKVLDIFSYISKNVIDLKQLEDIFHNGIDDAGYVANDYYVERYVQDCKIDKNIMIVVCDLENERKNIAFIKKCEKVIAVVGYREITFNL